MKRIIVVILLVLSLVVIPVSSAMADTTADLAITATPSYIAIAGNESDYDFGTVAASSTTQTTTTKFGITNTSSIQTDQTISVTTTEWDGGVGGNWTHDDTATPGADTAGLKSNRGGTWGVGDVIVKNAAPNYIYENCAASTSYGFGLQLLAPTSFSDGTEKAITVRVSAAAG